MTMWGHDKSLCEDDLTLDLLTEAVDWLEEHAAGTPAARNLRRVVSMMEQAREEALDLLPLLSHLTWCIENNEPPEYTLAREDTAERMGVVVLRGADAAAEATDLVRHLRDLRREAEAVRRRLDCIGDGGPR